MRHVFVLALIVLAAGVVHAEAQVVNISGYTIRARTQDRLSEKQGLLVGSVELERGDTTIYADQVEYFEDEDRALATGNVVFTQGNNRIAADRAEFNTRTGLGTFYNASGISSVQPPRLAPQGGISVPTQSGQDTDVYFFGEVIEKLGAKKYKITNGGFSTCVQPTPRWDLTAGSVVLNIDDYTLLRNAIFHVKNVPVFYLPALYYPTQEDGRATGFLLPTYGSSNLRGQTISNAFFWAINRSSDATVMLDWFSKTGVGGGLEYRYALARGNGDIRAYQLNQRNTTYQLPGGGTSTVAGSQQYTVRGGMNQVLPGNLRASANIDYFTSLQTNQTFNTNVNVASQNVSYYAANVVGSWRAVSMNANFARREVFTSQTTSIVSGGAPRVSLTRSERPLFRNAPVFVGFTADAGLLQNVSRVNGEVVNPDLDDRSLGRVDFVPTLRYPVKQWQWFTFSPSVKWQGTYYTRTQDPLTRAVLDQPLTRQFVTLGFQSAGPVFNRIWNTPDNGYAERFKHTIEPFFNADRTSLFENRDRILSQEAGDFTVGGNTTLTYGLNNRVYAKRRMGTSPISQAQEILYVQISQRYYTDASASIVDPNVQTSNTTTQTSNFGPISATLRATPGRAFSGDVRAELDARHRKLRMLSVSANQNGQRITNTIGWSRTFFIADLPYFNDRNLLTHSVNLSTNLRTLDNKYGTTYSLSYDVQRSLLVQQQMTAFYNAQCCGLAMQYQRYNTPAGLFLPNDNRFFVSFTLAGLGNFSPMNGGLSGAFR